MLSVYMGKQQRSFYIHEKKTENRSWLLLTGMVKKLRVYVIMDQDTIYK